MTKGLLLSDEGQKHSITFSAALPDILSAISLSGFKDGGARVKLDVPATDAQALLLLQYYGAGQPLKVTIEVLDDDRTGERKSRNIHI